MKHRWFVVLVVFIAVSSIFAGDRIPEKTWQRYVDPEQAGFSADKLAEAREYWESIGSSAVMVVYQGAVLVDWGETNRRFRCHSARKSLMSGMYGVFIDDGTVDPTLTMEQLGIDDDPSLTKEERQATVADLLSARSGVYRLAAYEPPQNRKPERGTHPPGTNWVYNNWDFNTLVTILEQQAKIEFFEEFDRRFARPLGMQDYDPSHGYMHYERDKSIHPAYPFRMSARDMARFGLLYLNDGKWGKQRILSSDYIKHSTEWISDTGNGGGYGYLWWIEGEEQLRELGMYSALGVGGQSIDVLPGAEMVFINRANTYLTGSVSNDERTTLIRMILDARVGESVKKPQLESLPEAVASHEIIPVAEKELASYVAELPIGSSDRTLKIFLEDGQLQIEFGEGPIPLHKIGPDHFIIEDHLEHIYFEQASDGSQQAIIADLLLIEGSELARDGEIERARDLFARVIQFFPMDPRPHEAIARIHLRNALEEIDAAAQGYQKIAELQPEQTLAHSDLAWEILNVKGRVMPPDTAPDHLARFAGSYGPRQIDYENGQLFYSRGGRPRVKLIPLTENIYQHETADGFRVRFDTDATGRVFQITGLYRGGRHDLSLRD